MPRFVHLIALALVFAMSGAPTWIAEAMEDDCAEECASESGCPDEGCADCSIVCSSCPRAHFVAPQTVTLAPTPVGVSSVAHEAGKRLPQGPPPKGVFHPPRRAG